MRRLIILVLAAVLSAAGCSDARSGSLGPAPTLPPAGQSNAASSAPGPAGTSSGPAGPDRSPPPATPRTGMPRTGAVDPGGDTLTVQLWFTHGGRLHPTRRTRPVTLATSRLALTELTAGPTAAEHRAGLITALPAEPGFTIEGITDKVATVDFASAFYTGASSTVRLRQAQVVYTLTQFPTVSQVRFRSTGQSAGRSAYADLLPPIVVLDPVVGQRVTSPITVTGTADVFEATVSVRLLDGAGRQLATAFTTATCGSGCRGSYRLTLPYRSNRAETGTVEVYQVSAQDGSRRDVVTVPVRLAASI